MKKIYFIFFSQFFFFWKILQKFLRENFRVLIFFGSLILFVFFFFIHAKPDEINEYSKSKFSSLELNKFNILSKVSLLLISQ